jgi:hypothetical protein
MTSFFSIFSLEDGDSMFIRNVGIYRRVYTAPNSRRTSPSSAVKTSNLIKHYTLLRKIITKYVDDVVLGYNTV